MKTKHRGVIKYFDSQKGFGFIFRPGLKDTFVHIKEFRGLGPREFNQGDEVSFDEEYGDQRGPRAVNVIVNVRAPEQPLAHRHD